MNTKEVIIMILSSSVVSTCVATLISPFLEWMRSKIEKNKIIDERRYNEEKQLKQQQEKIYVDAIRIIQLIKNGFFDRTLQQLSNMPLLSKHIKEKSDELNNKVETINEMINVTMPLMRIYATDEINELFSKLIKYGKFSYSKNIITQFLLYSFDRDFSHMCKLMQKTLEIRIDNPKLPEPHICPNCGNMHNSEENCPICGIIWVAAIDLEDKFNSDCSLDEEVQELLNLCVQKGQDPLLLLSYPISKDKWKEQMRKYCNE